MNGEGSFQYDRDCDFIKVDDPDHIVPSFPIRANGIDFLPAHDWEFGTVEVKPGSLLGALFFSLRTRVGIHMLMSPATMRTLAARLLRVAGEIENRAAVQSADVLARASHPGAAS